MKIVYDLHVIYYRVFNDAHFWTFLEVYFAGYLYPKFFGETATKYLFL